MSDPRSRDPGSLDYLGLDGRHSEAPEATALLAPSREPLMYGQLWDAVQTTREALHQFGAGFEDVTALALPTGPELITAFLAIAGTGACAPLDPALTETEAQFCLRRLGARTVLVDDASRAAAAAARSLGIRVLTLQVDTNQRAGIFTLADTSAGRPIAPGRQTRAALLLFTSATTDSPKLVPLTVANLRALATHDSRALQLGATDRLLSLMPYYHLHGLAAALTQLSCGGSVICTSGFDPSSFTACVSEMRPTWLTSSPPINRSILTLARQNPELFRQLPLRFIRSGTARLDPQLLAMLEEATGVPVLNGYGMTETGGVTRNTLDRRKPGSVGRSSGVDLAIMDPAGNFLPAENEGEVAVRGPSVTCGYLDNPEANGLAFRNSWFHTGDIGRLDSEGFLFLTGRLKEIINRGGEKITPEEVEAVLLAHPGIAEVAVCAIPHASLGEDVAAAVILRQESGASETELRQFAASQLAPFKVPRRIVIVQEIPRTATGKPKRATLSEQIQNLNPPNLDRTAPELEPLEQILAGIWQRILHIPKIDARADFFALGGDSLAAALMLVEVQKSLHAASDLLGRVDFFDSPTIATLARIVTECGVNEDSDQDQADQPINRVLSLRESGSRTPFFCFPASAQDPYYLRYLAKHMSPEQPFYVVCHNHPLRKGRLLPIEELASTSVEAIRRARPHGPYIIGGHCYGGIVAFETAVQLMAQGERLDSLVLFDVPTPGYPKPHKQWKQYVSKAGEMVSAVGRGKAAAAATFKAVRQHVYTLGKIFARRRTGSASRALAAMGSDAMVQGQERKTLNGMVMWEYTPREFQAPMIHFIAADQHVSTEVLSDPRLGWNDLSRAGLSERRVKGDHNSILGAEHAPAVAQQLNDLLSAPGNHRLLKARPEQLTHAAGAD